MTPCCVENTRSVIIHIRCLTQVLVFFCFFGILLRIRNKRMQCSERLPLQYTAALLCLFVYTTYLWHPHTAQRGLCCVTRRIWGSRLICPFLTFDLWPLQTTRSYNFYTAVFSSLCGFILCRPRDARCVARMSVDQQQLIDWTSARGLFSSEPLGWDVKRLQDHENTSSVADILARLAK